MRFFAGNDFLNVLLTSEPDPFPGLRRKRIKENFIPVEEGLRRSEGEREYPYYSTMHINDLRGRLVRSLINNQPVTRTGELTWNLKDAGGRRVVPGVYLLTMRSDGVVKSTRIVVHGH